MRHRVAHGVDRATAKRATVAAMETYATRYGAYGPRTEWTSEHAARVRVSIRGVTLDGEVEIHERDVIVSMAIPLLFRPFQARAIAVVEREIRAWCERARDGHV